MQEVIDQYGTISPTEYGHYLTTPPYPFSSFPPFFPQMLSILILNPVMMKVCSRTLDNNF